MIDMKVDMKRLKLTDSHGQTKTGLYQQIKCQL